jgi:DNA-binding beta-propeller fold protein YncE
MAIAPAGFGTYGGDLFVSVSGSTQGGGDLGTIYVVDPATGALVATFDQGSATNPLDPRGLLFTTIDGQTVLLASNGDPEIDIVTSKSFTATAPEIDPASAASAMTLLLGGLLVLTGRRVTGRAAA